MKRKFLDPERPGISYARHKGHYTIRLLHPVTKKRISCGTAYSLDEAKRKWDAAKAKLETSSK